MDLIWSNYAPCNGFSYTFTYVSGTQTPVNSNDLSINIVPSTTNKFNINFSDLTWVGTHVIEISGCVGDSAIQLFNTNCASSQATIDVVDPCETANFVQTISISYLKTTLESDKIGT